jgi:hypothetical protein
MKKILLSFLGALLLLSSLCQPQKPAFTIKRPKFVVGIMAAGMRWDSLYLIWA